MDELIFFVNSRPSERVHNDFFCGIIYIDFIFCNDWNFTQTEQISDGNFVETVYLWEKKRFPKWLYHRNFQLVLVEGKLTSDLFVYFFVEDEANQIHFSRLRPTEYILDVTSEFVRNKRDFSLVFQRTVWFFPFRQTDNNLYNDLMFFQVRWFSINLLIKELTLSWIVFSTLFTRSNFYKW